MLRLHDNFPSFSPVGDLIAIKGNFLESPGLMILKSYSFKRWILLQNHPQRRAALTPNPNSAPSRRFRVSSRRDHVERASKTRFHDGMSFSKSYELGRPSRGKGEEETHAIPSMETKVRRADQTKWKVATNLNSNSLHSNDDLNALLKDEDLVIAHRRQVEETIGILWEKEQRTVYQNFG